LEKLTRTLEHEGYAVSRAQTAPDCLAAIAATHPDVVVLDIDLLYVDRQNIAEYITHISESTMVLLTVDDLSRWRDARPPFVRAVQDRTQTSLIVEQVRDLAR